MGKQTFTVPEGTKEIVFDRVDDTIVMKFVPEKVEFKDGDIVANAIGNWLFIFNRKVNYQFYYHYALLSGNTYFKNWSHEDNFERLATDSEKQLLFDALAKEGLKWNAESKKVEKVRWRAEEGDYYWCYTVSGVDQLKECGNGMDKMFYSVGNYFQTERQAKTAFKKVKELLLSL